MVSESTGSQPKFDSKFEALLTTIFGCIDDGLIMIDIRISMNIKYWDQFVKISPSNIHNLTQQVPISPYAFNQLTALREMVEERIRNKDPDTKNIDTNIAEMFNEYFRSFQDKRKNADKRDVNPWAEKNEENFRRRVANHYQTIRNENKTEKTFQVECCLTGTIGYKNKVTLAHLLTPSCNMEEYMVFGVYGDQDYRNVVFWAMNIEKAFYMQRITFDVRECSFISIILDRSFEEEPIYPNADKMIREFEGKEMRIPASSWITVSTHFGISRNVCLRCSHKKRLDRK
jgi:hypothetical protein